MDSTHVIALIASNLQVRNAVLAAAEPSPAKREKLVAAFGDPIDEAKELIRQVMSDEPRVPAAPNTMARHGTPKEE